MPRPVTLSRLGWCLLLVCSCIATVTEEASPDPSSSSRRATGDSDDGGRIRLMDDAGAPDTRPAPDADVVDDCRPDCTGLSCGDDGCGGSCGACPDGAGCTRGVCDPPPPPLNCPPTGSTGSSPGSTAPDITLYDCEGGSIQSHSTCGTPVYVYSHSESCGSCIAFAHSEANDVARELQATGAEYWFIVTIGRGFSPDASDCRRVRESYGLEMPVFFVRDMWDFSTLR